MSRPQTTILKRSCGNSSFPHKVARALRDKAELNRQAISSNTDGAWATAQIKALEDAAEYLDVAPLGDPVVYGLWVLQSLHGSSDDFDPTETQLSVIARAGHGGESIPDRPEDFAAELLAAGIEDISAARRAERTQATSEIDQLRKLEPYVDRAEKAEARVTELEAGLAVATEAAAEAAKRERHVVHQLAEVEAMLSERKPKPRAGKRTSAKERVA
jgi:hypothetical protein